MSNLIAPRFDPDRRLYLQMLAGCAAACVMSADAAAPHVQDRFGWLNQPVREVLKPDSAAAVAQALRASSGRVSVAGARYSMGGQIAAADSLHLDLQQMNRVLAVDQTQRSVRVQAGASWAEVQAVIDPLNLSVRTMQSFRNFSVGGSLSVNAHGRYVGHGALSATVRALQLATADGQLLELRRGHDDARLAGVLGGYGLLGVICEAELDLDANERLKRVIHRVPLADYPTWFRSQLAGNPDARLHNADLYPPLWDQAQCVTWLRSDAALTDPRRLMPRAARFSAERSALWAISELPGGDALRRHIVDPMRLAAPAVVWRNLQASLDTAMLQPWQSGNAAWALQEYFVPESAFVPFVRSLVPILEGAKVDVVNLSVRHAPADRYTLLSWAPEPVFSFVLFYRQARSPHALEAAQQWSRAAIDAALSVGGRHYLPYLLHASADQIRRGYPGLTALAGLKRELDPLGRFSNALAHCLDPG